MPYPLRRLGPSFVVLKMEAAYTDATRCANAFAAKINLGDGILGFGDLDGGDEAD